MKPLKKRWQIASRISPEADENLSEYPSILRQILFNRGYATEDAASQFLRAAGTSDSDPRPMLGVSTAADRIQSAIKNSEKIAVYGDYDTDGVTATALTVQTLQSLGADVRAYIPDRFDEGYGLNTKALDSLKAEGTRLIITVDCGIRALEEAEHARKIGLELIITDHHSVGDELPWATAVIDAKQPEDDSPEKNLAGVGTVYKLACALIERMGSENTEPVQLLDLVALGTVADLVPLVGENRDLVRRGIQQIHRQQRQGLLSLIGVTGLKPQRIKASNIGFILGPRLNAAGRLGSAMDAYNLLMAKDVSEAGRLAQDLDNINRQRQKITQDVMEASESMVFAETLDGFVLAAADPQFNLGIVGLAASRLVDSYYRPAIIAHKGEEVTRASCRSIPEFHITDALNQCADLLDHYGGHAAAAGFTVQNENWPTLIEKLESIAEEQLDKSELKPTLNAEAETPLQSLTPELLQQLDSLEPTGYGNPEAMFVTRDLKVIRSKAVGQDGLHLKMAVTDGKITFDTIAFRLGYWQEELPTRVDLLYSFELNEFNGQKSLQLNVRDLKPTKA
jgi:single-stranded-DNA-specific exonuclease